MKKSHLLLFLMAVAFLPMYAQTKSEIYLTNIQTALESHDTPLATSILKEWEDQDNDSPDLYIAKSLIVANTDSVPRAILLGLFREAAGKYPQRLDYRLYFINELLMNDHRGEAINAFKKLHGELNQHRSGWTQLGDTIAEKDLDDFIAEFMINFVSAHDDVEDIKPFLDGLKAEGLSEGLEFPIYIGLAYIYIENEDYAKAFEMYEKAYPFSVEPEKTSLELSLASLGLRLGRKGDSAKYARNVISSNSSNAEMKSTARSILEYIERPLSYWDFEHQYLPSLIQDKQPTRENLDFLNNPEAVLEYFKEKGVTFGGELSAITSQITKHTSSRDMSKTTEIVIWTMPEPKVHGDSKFVAFIPDGDRIRFFTLEKSYNTNSPDGIYIICENEFSDSGARIHRTYGLDLKDDPNLFPFIMLAMKVVNGDYAEKTDSYTYFEKFFLPQLAAVTKPSKDEDEFLADVEGFLEWHDDNYLRIDRDLSALKSESFEVDSVPVTVWTMLPPEDMTSCKYVAFVPDGDRYRFFTLEKTFSDDSEKNLYMLCETYFTETGERTHRNYNLTLDDTFNTDQFAQSAVSIVKMDYQPSIISSIGNQNDTSDEQGDKEVKTTIEMLRNGSE